jgi:hypothetical protein
MILATVVVGHDGAAEAEKEGGGKSDFRLGAHCRISYSIDRLNLPFA